MNLKEKVELFNLQNVVNGKSGKVYGGWCHFAAKDFQPGEVVVFGWGRPLDHQTGHCSIQTGAGSHILPTKNTGRYWNHSCDPNCHVKSTDYGTPCLVASKFIAKGEEITFSYFMTEFSFGKHTDEATISCGCGSANCVGKIRSFSELTRHEKIAMYYKKQISKYLSKYVEQHLIVNKNLYIEDDSTVVKLIG